MGQARDALKLIDQAILETALDKQKTGTALSASPSDLPVMYPRKNRKGDHFLCEGSAAYSGCYLSSYLQRTVLPNKTQGPCDLTESPSGLAL